ncbi:Transcription factor bye1 [Marasmius tenuissimus]|uniref:Transcription factor BYE1 n=1 Tax=Marasmius tenuissimus TaxID=585030 RepID=A0ABR2ZVN3_9AGAR
MSTRTTRAKAQSNTAAASSITPSTSAVTTKEKQSSKRRSSRFQADDGEGQEKEEKNENLEEKENVKTEGHTASAKATGKSASSRKTGAKGKAKVEDPFCSCKKGDDGTPMVYCVECKNWYHFACVSLDEKTAEEIMNWEGADAVEEATGSSQKPAPKTTRKKKSATPTNPEATKTSKSVPDPPDEFSQESDDPGSEDDYTEDEVKAKVSGKRRLRQNYESGSDSDSSAASETLRKRRLTKGKPAGSSSPGPSGKGKRKISTSTAQPPPPKKAKTTTTSLDPVDDPTRKYCLGKLEELFRDIFLRYPHLGVSGNGEGDGDESVAEKKPEELTEEEKATVLASAKKFADDLEACVYEIYCEPDKSGHPSAGGKYKDRFRTIQFNLSKRDRVVIHKRIASNQISPKEISVMSSTDLANEELKQSIRIAEKEALEHSILKKVTAPRAKITHKGLEDIEDINGSLRESERRQEDEERMERERMERLRAAPPRQRTMSMSIPPESPVVPQSGESWGAPPPVPSHVFSPTDGIPSGDFNPDRPSLLVNTDSDMVMQEPELNLADFINIDDEPDTEEASKDTPHPSASLPDATLPMDATGLKSPVSATTSQPPPPTTPISPFANVQHHPSTPTDTPTTSFNLNSLWSVPSHGSPMSPVDGETSTPPSREEGGVDVVMGSTEPLGGGAANDGDFDMFLEEKEPLTPEAARALFDAMPHVWTGKISMPLDSTIPQETPVTARQMGGRPMEADSLLWKTLFPSDSLRIDGRVPVANSAKFLLQMRMNPSKELIAVVFSPSTDGESGFKTLSDFLIAKGRHGLVFPWGQRPKDYHPGKEMYIVPLLSSEPLPDYMELLDDLKLPKERTSDYLVGIWWLNKGKLAPPPSSAPTSVPPPPATAPPSSSTLGMSPVPPTQSTPPIPSLPALPGHIASLAATLPVDQKALAAELATLTPEQMDIMMRALAASSVPPALGSSPVPPQPVAIPAQPQQPPDSGYPGSLPPWPPAGNYPPMPPYPSSSSSHHNFNGPPPHQFPDHGDRGGSGSGGGRRGSGGNGGGRGNRGGRNRGEDWSRKPVDSGWNRKRSMQADSPQGGHGGWS